jgi:hypothetical protein
MKTCWSSEPLKTIVLAYMPITIEWPEIALRLTLTVVAGTLIGLNRNEHGHSAGLRTTLLGMSSRFGQHDPSKPES